MKTSSVLTGMLCIIIWGTILHADAWNTVVLGESIPIDLDTSYLHVKTNSTGGNRISIHYFNEGGVTSCSGGIAIDIATVESRLLWCQSFTPLLRSLPAGEESNWIIEKRGFRNIVYCNGKQVIDVTAGEETCHWGGWGTCWREHEVIKIAFSEWDTASDLYYIGSEMLNCTGLDGKWTNMKTDADFPVLLGSKISLSCKEGYRLRGDKIVSCHRETQFYYHTEPNCERFKTIHHVLWGLGSLFLVTTVIMTIVAVRKFLLRKCPCESVDEELEAEYINAETFQLQASLPPLPPHASPLPPAPTAISK